MAMEENKQAEIITVGKRTDDSKAVWDRDPLHPSNYGSAPGEVFISDMRPYRAHRSAGIAQKIGERVLEELSRDEIRSRTDEAVRAEEDAAPITPSRRERGCSVDLPNFLRRRFRLGRRMRKTAVQHGNTARFQELLGLVFMDVHSFTFLSS